MQLTSTYQKIVQKKFQRIPPDVGLMVEFAKSQGDGERDGGFAGGGSAADEEEVFGCRASGWQVTKIIRPNDLNSQIKTIRCLPCFI